MIAYKATGKDCICRGYQFDPQRINRTSKANCRKNGFHCASNPLDCFHYYDIGSGNEFWLVEAEGDINEDNSDSKISCTEMRFVQQLTAADMIVHGIWYLLHRPERMKDYFTNSKEYAGRGYRLVCGTEPQVNCLPEKPEIIGMIRTDRKGDPLLGAVLDYQPAAKDPGVYVLDGDGRIRLEEPDV